jgi:hypothetical protein
MMLSRLDGGSGVERNYSSDGGRTWTITETDLPRPFIGPGSKLEIRKLASGNLLLLTNDSNERREKITAFLSLDDGQTWPHELVLDDRDLGDIGFWGVSYPNFTQGTDGTIYAIWDQRTPMVEVNMARFTEQDMISGQLSNSSFTFRNIVRNSDYVDIETVSETYQRRHDVEIGASLSDIIAELPATLHVTDSNQQDITLTGQWASNDYNSSVPGTYRISFIPESKPNKLLDSFGYLRIKIVVLEPEEQPPLPTETGLETWHIVLMTVGGLFTLGLIPLLFVLLKKGLFRHKPVKNK